MRTCIILRFEKKKEPEVWKQLHVKGVDGIWCQLFQVVMKLLQKRWEWQEDRRKNCWHGSERRPAMHIASTDINRAFDVARSKNIVNIVVDKKPMDG